LLTNTSTNTLEAAPSLFAVAAEPDAPAGMEFRTAEALIEDDDELVFKGV